MVFNIVLLIVAYNKTYFNYHEPWEKIYIMTSTLNLMICGCIFVGLVRKQLGLLALFVNLGGPIAFVNNCTTMVDLFDNDRNLFLAFIYMLNYCIWFGMYSINVWQHCMELFEV